MTIKKLIRDASAAILCAMLASSMVFQLALGAAAGTIHATKQAENFNRIGVFCASFDERDSQNRSAPIAGHHGEDRSACCTWGGRDTHPGFTFLPHLAASFDTHVGDVRGASFARPLGASIKQSRGLRPQAQRAPPSFI